MKGPRSPIGSATSCKCSLRDFLQTHPLQPDDLKAMKRIFPELLKVVARMQQDGVMLLAGTDIAGPRIPGFSLQDELSVLVQAGLTPLQALQTATLNPATVLEKTTASGTVEPGKIADLVLLDANPLEDIHNANGINEVIVDGILYRRVDLDGMLRDAEIRAEQE